MSIISISFFNNWKIKITLTINHAYLGSRIELQLGLEQLLLDQLRHNTCDNCFGFNIPFLINNLQNKLLLEVNYCCLKFGRPLNLYGQNVFDGVDHLQLILGIHQLEVDVLNLLEELSFMYAESREAPI